MLWYKDKTKSQLWFERVAIIFAIAVISYTLGFMYQKLKDNVCRNLQTQETKSVYRQVKT